MTSVNPAPILQPMHSSAPYPNSASPVALSRTSSMRSKFSNDIERVAVLLNNNIGQQIKQAAKVALVTMPPILMTVVLSALGIASSKWAYDETNRLINDVTSAQQIGDLLERLQVERGLTCLCSSSSIENRREAGCHFIHSARDKTDTSLLDINTSWINMHGDPEMFKSKLTFSMALGRFRALVDSAKDISCEEIIKFYSEAASTLIEFMLRALQSSEGGQFWNTIEAYHLFLMAMDNMGLKRALAGAYFASGTFDDSTESIRSYAHFVTVNGTATNLLNTVLQLNPKAKSNFLSLTSANRDLILHMINLESLITNNRTDHYDRKFGTDVALHWFTNMTSYMNLLNEIDTDLRQYISAYLMEKAWQKKYGFMATLGSVGVVIFTSICLLLWYVREWRRLMNRVQTYAKKLDERTQALKREKAKTELLLAQMLPKSIMHTLRARQKVEPEQFDSVTIAFSDIVHFTTLAAKSNPLQVVDLLNVLYCTLDDILDLFDVYKVETIGDAYMICSGVPRRNEHMHSSEIATLALQIMMTMRNFRIPHMPGKQIFIRFGIHTGPCAAGVVGTKMPRYCLFGDTVNMASRMESHGHAMKIHLSPDTVLHLAANHPDIFEMVPRGMIRVKGKGMVPTSWLIGKGDYAYKIDLKEADELFEKYKMD